MVNTAADDQDTMGDDQPIVLLGQGQEMREHTPRPQPPAPAPRPETLEPHPQPRTPQTHPLSALEHLGLLTPQEPRLAVPTLQEAEAAGNTSDVDVDQQLLIESAGGDSFPNVPLPEERPDGSVGEEWNVLIYLSQALIITCFARFLDRTKLILFMGFVLVILYWFYFIHSVMGHCACCVFATPGV